MQRMYRILLIAALCALPLASFAAQVETAPASGPQVLNLKDADITALISTVAEITGKNFIVGPNVQGKVTVVSSEPMAAAEVYELLLAVLRVHGYAALPAGDGMIKIVSEASARQDGAVPVGPSAAIGDPLVTEVVEVRHVPAAELASILQQFIPQGAQVVAHGASNTLILSDRASVVQRLRQIISRVDTASDARVEVIPLQHANATEVARTLTRLTESGPGTPSGSSVDIVADTRTNSILLSGNKSRRLRLRTLILHLDTPLDAGGATHVVYLQYAIAKDLVPVLQSVARTLTDEVSPALRNATAQDGGIASGDGGGVATIQAHEATNALVISAPPAVFRSLKSVIRKLDVRRAQVLIEAVIAEVSVNAAREIGVQWQLPLKTNADGSIDNSVIGGTNFTGPNGGGNILDLVTNPLALGGGFNLGYLNGSITLPGSDTPILQIGALIRALQGTGNANILSTPSVVTLDNHKAEITVAKEVPFVTGQYTSTGTGSNLPNSPFQTIERKDVGLTLTVTPHVNEGDAIRLDIHQVVSSLAPQVSQAVDLVTNKREIKTSVLVQDDSLLVLGGLISNEVTDSVQKVPLLGDIPWIGNLFKYRSSSRSKRDLMVFLHPRILRDAATELAISSEKYNYIRTEQLKMRADDALLSPQDHRPLLPEVRDFLAHPAGQPVPAANRERQ